MPDGTDHGTALLTAIGARVRASRKAKKLPRRALAESAEVSERHLAQLETGSGNISILLLDRIASALELRLTDLVAPPDKADNDAKAHRIALIGLRGAGKTTLGRRTADELGVPFIESNARVAEEAGLSPAEIFALYGEDGYRRLEAQVIANIAARDDPVILTIGGGIVTQAESFDSLLTRFHTVWIKATPEEHMARVQAQGDERPMAGDPNAMTSLRDILDSRSTAYARADITLDTAHRPVDICAQELTTCVRSWIMNGGS